LLNGNDSLGGYSLDLNILDSMVHGMDSGNRSEYFAAGAFGLFSQRGLDAVTMDDIAAAGEATKGSLYWHYKSKDEVIEAACRHYYRQWHKDAQRGTALINDPVEKLRIIVSKSVRSCLIDEGNRVFTMEILARALHDNATREGWRQFFESVRAFYLALVETSVELGLLKLENPEKAVDVMLSAMEGYKLRAVFEPDLCSKVQESAITEHLLSLLNIN
jgi:AcrR family transcriptional regulator